MLARIFKNIPVCKSVEKCSILFENALKCARILQDFVDFAVLDLKVLDFEALVFEVPFVAPDFEIPVYIEVIDFEVLDFEMALVIVSNVNRILNRYKYFS